ncbi:MAG: tRNA pseudouridine(38-40) synthase TruA [Firmicutes bacterium]|nr:tRNA pseudouridine(38-40) synthase TruA [Bacillota bacterium]
MNIKIKISYDGTSFCGWQKQAVTKQTKGKDSVQGLIENALFSLTNTRLTVTGSGRTDAGVHALAQTASFCLQKHFDTKKIVKGLNFYLPAQIRVFDAQIAPKDFDARKSATKKTYIYKMYLSDFENPVFAHRALCVSPKVDVEKMKQAACLFVGQHDFKCFMSSGSTAKNTIRHIYDCKIIKTQTDFGHFVTLKITGNGFLYNMVRKIAAVILSVGLGKADFDKITNSLNCPFDPIKDIVPPFGLYLHSVEY